MTMEHKVNLGIVSRTLETLIERDGRSVSMLDRSTGETVPVSPGLAASADGLLPVFLVAGDAVWREATSRSFGVELSREPRALLGYRAHGVSGGPFNCLMLSMMEAIDLVGGPRTILVNDFDGLWRGIEADIRKALAPHHPATPSPSAS